MKAHRKKLARYIAHRINLKTLDSSRGVLQYLADHGHVSLAQTASALGLSRGTCNLHLQRLEAERLIRRFESKKGGAGRPTVIWGWDETANLTLSLVFDVPFLHASVSDFGLQPVLREVRDLSGVTSRGEVEEIVMGFVARAREMAAQRGSEIREAIVFLPGLIDSVSGTVRKAANFPVLDGIDFSVVVRKALPVSCHSVPLGLAFYFGESESLPAATNTMVIYWDLGVGVMFGHGDRLSSLGVNRDDGAPTLPELGHIRIAKAGRKCHCGRSGCLEAYAGGWALIERMKGRGVTRLADFIHWVGKGDAEALRLAGDAAELLGTHLAYPIQVMQTSRIRVTGPMAPVFGMVAERFRRGLAQTLTQDEVDALNPESSPAREERFLRGAHRLARRMYTHPADYGLLLPTPARLDG